MGFSVDRLMVSIVWGTEIDPTMLALYQESLQLDLRALRSALASVDWPKARHFIHRMKGSSLLVGDEVFTEMIQTLDQRLHWGPNQASIQALMARLETLAR